MKKIFYIVMFAVSVFSLTSFSDRDSVVDHSQIEMQKNGDNVYECDNDNPEISNSASGNVLVVYYSYTNNTHAIVTDLVSQIDADVIRIEPAEKGLDYAADNYALGSALIASIRENTGNASSYPAIDPVEIEFANYDRIIVAAPLWWSRMAAPLQSFLFNYGAEMSGKDIGLIVCSASSGIRGVEADAKRLIPGGNFLNPSLWIRSSQISNCHDMISKWLDETGLKGKQ